MPDHDVRTEEDELLPRMQELLSPRRLRLLGWQYRTRLSRAARRARSCPRCR